MTKDTSAPAFPLRPYPILAVALLLAGCDGPSPEIRAQWDQKRTTMRVDDEDSIVVVRVARMRDDLAYNGNRGIYRITDRRTGDTFIGISGIGIAETGSHLSGKVTRGDER